MKLVLGFSRGGTHLLWTLLASHPELLCPQIELNDYVGRGRHGLINKLLLEFGSIARIPALSRASKNLSALPTAGNVVHKGVSSWARSNLFRILRRHDVTKYVPGLLPSLSGAIVILVKSPEQQIASWMRRGCSIAEGERAYLEHVAHWGRISRIHPVAFLRYDDFAGDPAGVCEAIWRLWRVSPVEFPATFVFAPKASQFSQTWPEAGSAERTWVRAETSAIVESLRRSVAVPAREHPRLAANVWEQYENIDFLSLP
ncbi:hypothetical protein [Pelagibacterium halotolerans]|uniref:hypothetical protein n=1 Tax=Pelagibacterium halotolerans TaxID=531813 RepID=UPI000899021C|nr:hypothetical protein [Pelagibacterium halotolerans]QJR17215.1 hypothetical protein HKM20_01310 [Pelagibacterium halotolerans]SEA88877.1 hypothetical protein SAMN05428936_11122 [Pelagibacterium halotolerans]